MVERKEAHRVHALKDSRGRSCSLGKQQTSVEGTNGDMEARGSNHAAHEQEEQLLQEEGTMASDNIGLCSNCS